MFPESHLLFLDVVYKAVPVLVVIVSLGVIWGTKTRRDNDVWDKIHEIDQWKSEHEKVWSERWDTVNKQMAVIATALAIREEQYKEILRRFDQIEESIQDIKLNFRWRVRDNNS
jgi:phosphoglycerate-specific signal transduction histidine kinase